MRHGAKKQALVLALGMCWLGVLHAQSPDEVMSMSLEDLVNIPLNIATGTPITSQQAPAATSVITADDLAAMGAQSLDEALETVPGLQLSRSGIIMAPRYFIRGIASTNNPQTLLLVNGLPMTSLWQGDRGPAWQGVPVAAIKRVEIIRGPGSAVYGADAFAGVINIITWGAADVQGGSATLAHGSFDSTQAGLTQGGQIGPVRAALMLNWQHTQGEHGMVQSDAQTGIDALGLGPPASLAPGPVNVGMRDIDARLALQWKNWQLRTDWQQAWDIGTGAGVAHALDPNGRFGSRTGNADLLWDEPARWRNWDVSTRLSYSYKSFGPESTILFFPPGAFGGSFPQGVIDNPYLAEENIRIEQAVIFDGFRAQRLRAGLGYYRGNLLATDEHQNYDSTQAVPVPFPDGVRDVRGTPNLFQPTGKRSDSYAFMQDEWSLAPDWQLTAGVRNDHYSDFGDTTNPRLALVWNSTPTLTTKLIYGEAFRAPSFAELYVKSNPVNLGNPKLHPEKMRSGEVDFAYRPGNGWTLDLSLYRLRIRDFITYVPDASGSFYTAENVGQVNGRGFEAEARYQILRLWQLTANISAQTTTDAHTGQPLGLAPRTKGALGSVWSFQPQWQLNTQINAIGDRERQAGDPRDKLAGYTTCDITLRRLHLPHHLDLSLSGKNIFDNVVREPSPGPGLGQTTPDIPYDFPEAGRSVVLMAEVIW